MNPPSAHTLRTGFRIAAAAAGRILPESRNVAFERWLRGYEEAGKLARADAVIVSFGKSGRTWLRVLLSRYLARRYGLPPSTLIEFDEFKRHNPDVPILLFTHDNYLKDYTGSDGKFANYGGSKVVLLARDPRDIAVSQYFQWKHRIRRRKKIINGYPLEDNGIYEFITGEAAGVPKIVRFMNSWANELSRFPQLTLVRYEDLRTDTNRQLAQLLAFLGQSPTEAELDDCVAYGSVENMRRMELGNADKISFNMRLKPVDANDPSSFKVRRAKVGGWRDYVTLEEAEVVDRMVRTTLSPLFNYGEDQT